MGGRPEGGGDGRGGGGGGGNKDAELQKNTTSNKRDSEIPERRRQLPSDQEQGIAAETCRHEHDT